LSLDLPRPRRPPRFSFAEGFADGDSMGFGLAASGLGEGMGSVAISPPSALYGLVMLGYDSMKARNGSEAYSACRIELQ
jgi:hypothetical protein